MVVLLCDVQSFSYQEAADMLSIPIGSAVAVVPRSAVASESAVGAGGGVGRRECARRSRPELPESLEKLYEFLDGDLERRPRANWKNISSNAPLLGPFRI